MERGQFRHFEYARWRKITPKNFRELSVEFPDFLTERKSRNEGKRRTLISQVRRGAPNPPRHPRLESPARILRGFSFIRNFPL